MMGGKKAWLAFLTCMTILIAVYVVDGAVIGQQREKFRAKVQSQLSTIEAKLEGGLNSRLYLEKGINAFILTQLAINPEHQITQEEMNNFGKQFMPHLLGIRNITLIRNNIITHVYPLAGNEKAIGIDLSSITGQKSEVLKVVATGQSVLAGPVPLAQGGIGIINRSPIYWIPQGTNEALYWGQSSLVLMEDDLFQEAGLYNQPGLNLAIRGLNGLGNKGEMFWGDGEVFNSDPVIVDIKIPSGYWQLAAVPVGGWANLTPLIYWIGISGCILALSCGALVWFLLCSIEAKNQLKYISFHDALTGLYNRYYFEETIKRLENNNSGVGLLVCDLDGLKMINDTLGHECGDQILIRVALILEKSFGKGDIVARMGGDEFAVITKDFREPQMRAAKGRILQEINTYNTSTHNIPMSLSIGYGTIEDSSISLKELFKEADNNMYREKLYQSQSARSAIVQTVMKLLEARDFNTEGHSQRLQDMVSALGKVVYLPEHKLIDLRLLAQFHDIGKVGIPDRILLKPGPLTLEETIEMKKHCDIGYRIALAAADLVPIAKYVLKHHEWWNGLGYPFGLAGEAIPLECRILAIADAFDAMTSDRPYRKAMTGMDAIAELKRYAGTQFDPVLVEKFCNIVG